MFEKFIALADLHLTSNPVDSYRWELFDWIEEKVKSESLTDVLLVGDITDFKDNHPSDMVNLLVDAMSRLSKCVRVHFLMGNHDMIKIHQPFFEFCKHLPGVHFYKTPETIGDVSIMPYTKAPEKAWEDYDFSSSKLVFIHQPCIGATSSEFYELEHGMRPDYFTQNHPQFKGKVFAGDIHIAQTIKDITYIGAPYPIRMNDTFEGNAIIFEKSGDDYTATRITHPSIRKITAEIDRPADLKKLLESIPDLSFKNFSSHIKVKVNFSGSAYERWSEWKSEIRKICDEYALLVNSIMLDSKSVEFKSVEDQLSEKPISFDNPLEVFDSYCSKDQIDVKLKMFGKNLLQRIRSSS